MNRFFQHICAFAVGALTTYMVVPYRCTLRDALGVVDADPGDAETIEIYSGTTLLGTLTWGSDIAAGALATFALDTTNGNTVLAAGTALKFVTSAGAAANVALNIQLDPNALTAVLS